MCSEAYAIPRRSESRRFWRRGGSCPVLIGIIVGFAFLNPIGAQTPENTVGAALLSKENIVDVASSGGSWTSATVGQPLVAHDRLRTGEDSRAAVRMTDLSVLRIDELTTIEITPPTTASDKPSLNVDKGAAYFFSREKSREMKVETPAANGAMRGTEFVVAVAANGSTTVTMLDGEVELSNAQGSLVVSTGEQAKVDVGGAPRKTAVLEAINSVQWCLYYPGVLDLKELGYSRDSNASTSAYQEGDLLAALAAYGHRSHSGSNADKVYHAGLLLAVGQVEKAKRLLNAASEGTPGRQALLTLIAAVTLKPRPDSNAPQTASDWIAESYYLQSQANLPAALEAAQHATEINPEFGFAWTRVAELHFSFGRIRQAKAALEKGVQLSPRNPAAHALLGFLFAAENKINEAKGAFEHAMAIDGALGNAWLGRGLCLIRQGKNEDGRRDLQVAAALEPNRAFFHSYLGKAFSNDGNEPKARLELGRAKTLDPKDPTPWIYSAIENKQDSRINEAVRDLEKSQELNDNRQVYRSQFLLDQDRAVRSANLAAIYQADGMEDVSVREATRGVDSDYATASSHLFLANSYNALRDPKRINLRYETPWFNELLLANLLSPVGGGPLSQFVSEQEYSKLFEADRFGISSETTYLSSGEIRETASQYGTFGNFSYSLDTDYHYDNGRRPNNEITRTETYFQVKVQLSPQDTIFFQTKYQDTRQGDLLQYYDQGNAAPGAHFRELQQPAILLLGYHHEWAPGIHTLLLAGRLADEITFSDLNTDADVASFLQTGRPNVSRSTVLVHDSNGEITSAFVVPLDLNYHNSFTTYTGELNQIWEQGNNTLIFGARFQSGEFHTSDRLDNPPAFTAAFFNIPAAAHDFSTSLDRQSVYIYDTWRPFRTLSLTAGLSYDRLEFPTNYRNAPIVDGEDSRDKLSPKAGVIWNPFGNFFVRGSYAQSLGGVSFDQSVGLEPNQVAGFNQVFRSIISESVAGSVAAPTYDTAGILIEDRFPTGTYVGLQAILLQSDVDRTVGTFDAFLNPPFPPFPPSIDPPIIPSSTPQKLRYEEQDLLVTVNQLVGDEWSFGARYQLSYANLQTLFPDIPVAVVAGADHREKATLHQGTLFALYNHRSGFFARLEGYWARQSNVGYTPDIPGDDIFQANAYIGYRFRRNFGDITLGFLNMTDQDYKLNPLNYYNELPRERTLVARVRFNF
jgi:tetratricopeptide (TPR) repeat protein